jgi:hypothetical protein
MSVILVESIDLVKFDLSLVTCRDAMRENLLVDDDQPPIFTCEAVLAEVTYLTRQGSGARVALIEMLAEGFLSIGLVVAEQHAALLTLLR